MLAAKRSTGIAPEMNLRSTLGSGKEALKLRADVQNRGISGPTKSTDVAEKLRKNKVDLGTVLFSKLGD